MNNESDSGPVYTYSLSPREEDGSEINTLPSRQNSYHNDSYDPGVDGSNAEYSVTKVQPFPFGFFWIPKTGEVGWFISQGFCFNSESLFLKSFRDRGGCQDLGTVLDL